MNMLMNDRSTWIHLKAFLDNMMSFRISLFIKKDQKLLSSQDYTKVLQQNLTVSNYMGHQIYHVLTVID